MLGGRLDGVDDAAHQLPPHAQPCTPRRARASVCARVRCACACVHAPARHSPPAAPARVRTRRERGARPSRADSTPARPHRRQTPRRPPALPTPLAPGPAPIRLPFPGMDGPAAGSGRLPACPRRRMTLMNMEPEAMTDAFDLPACPRRRPAARAVRHPPPHSAAIPRGGIAAPETPRAPPAGLRHQAPSPGPVAGPLQLARPSPRPRERAEAPSQALSLLSGGTAPE